MVKMLGTWCFLQDALECGSFIFNTLPLQHRPQVYDPKVHHICFHQVQDAENLPEDEREIQTLWFDSVTVTDNHIFSWHLPEKFYNIFCTLLQFLDVFVPDGCTHLAHGGDDVGSQALYVDSIVVSLLTDQVHVQNLHDLGSHSIGSRIKEWQEDLWKRNFNQVILNQTLCE